jgi:hypothetical protein
VSDGTEGDGRLEGFVLGEEGLSLPMDLKESAKYAMEGEKYE